MTTDNNSTNDDHWLATLYLLGELPEADVVTFEARLESDPELCLALSRAVRCQSGLRQALAETTSTVAPASKWRRVRQWSGIVTTAAAALLMSVGGFLWHQSTTTVDTGSAVQLVALWQRQADPIDAVADLDDDDGDATSADAVPEWLFAAVSMEHRPTLLEDPDHIEEN